LDKGKWGGIIILLSAIVRTAITSRIVGIEKENQPWAFLSTVYARMQCAKYPTLSSLTSTSIGLLSPRKICRQESAQPQTLVILSG
jgi:hypothetical protein